MNNIKTKPCKRCGKGTLSAPEPLIYLLSYPPQVRLECSNDRCTGSEVVYVHDAFNKGARK